MQKTSSGLSENIAALLGYLFPVIVPIIWLVTEKESRFVRFHALQAIFFDIACAVIMIAVSILGFIPIIGWLLSILVPLAIFAIWVLMLIKSYKGEMYKLPVLGDLAEKQM